ncbi:MAG: hypothetical protein DRP66_01385 [Planctomycetota bacterium]|nr:MAG: hypothetical protein DRP66_01385 [Planctomycetota bacterium]
MLETRHGIISSIHHHIKGYGGRYHEWCVGICSTKDREFLHARQADSDSLIFRKAQSPEDAQSVMAYFIYIYQLSRAANSSDNGNSDIVFTYKAD